MPTALKQQLAEFEAWAMVNQRDARRDAIKFWALKIPAILVSASSGIFAYVRLDLLTIIAGALASLCVLIDGLTRGGTLREVHLRAVFDLRNLQHDMVAQWRIGSVKEGTNQLAADQLAARIIEAAQTERKKIASYLRAAETNLSSSHHETN